MQSTRTRFHYYVFYSVLKSKHASTVKDAEMYVSCVCVRE